MTELDQNKIIIQIDENLFEMFWETYNNKLNLNKDFIKRVFVAVDIKYKKLLKYYNIIIKIIKVYFLDFVAS